MRNLAPYPFIVVILAGIVIAGQMVAGQSDFEQAQEDHRIYCQMVEAYKHTNGERGWPDYKGTYGQHCRENQQ